MKPSFRESVRGLLAAKGMAGDTLQTAIANIALSVLAFATGILAARLLGPAGRGELAAIQTSPGFIATLSTLGLGEALIYYAAQEPDRASRLLGSAVALGLAATMPFLVAGYFAMPYLLAAQSPSIVFAARCYLLLAPLYMLVGMPVESVRARKEFGPWNMLRACAPVCWLLVLVIAWMLGQKRAQFLSNTQLIALSLLSIPVWWIIVRRTPGSYRPEPGRWRPMLRFGLPSITANVPQILNLRLDQMLMAAILAPQLLGLYAVAVTWSGAGQAAIRALAVVSFPHLASLTDRPRQQARLFGRIVRTAMLLAAGVAGCLLACTPWGLPLVFGRAFDASVPAAIVLTIATAILGVNQIIEESLRGLGRPAMVLWAELAGLGVTGICLWLLLPGMGIMGAAIASLFGYGTVGLILIVEARILTGVSARALLLPSIGEFRAGLVRMGLMARA